MIKALLLFLIFLGSCLRVGPDFQPPEATIQDDWLEKSPLFIEEEVCLDNWWMNFHDDNLNDMVNYALASNYTIEAAANRILAARANLSFAIGEYFPQTQQAEGAAIRTHLSANAPNTLNAARDYWDNILGLRINWEIDFWGRFYRGVEAAYGEYLASKDDYRDVQRLLVSDLVLAYVQQKTFQRRIATLVRNITIQYRSVEIAKVRWDEGYESELDYAQAVTLWEETTAQKARLEIDLKRVTTSIAILLGITPEELACYYNIDASPIHAPVKVAIGYPTQVLCRRPDLRRSLDLLLAQSGRVGIAVSDLYPRISFTGFLGLECAADTHSTANQHGKHFFSRNSLSFFYGPEFVWPLLNYGRLQSKVMEQVAILNEGVALYRNQVLEAYKEVEDALTFYAQSIEETRHLDQSYKHAKRSVDISTIQYQEGLADYTRVLNSLQLQLKAEDSYVQAEGNISLAYAAIYKSLGAF